MVTGGYEFNSIQGWSYLLHTSEEWLNLPNLNEPRVRHSSCSLDLTCYVFGGESNNKRYLNSLEWLQIPEDGTPVAQEWQSCEVDQAFEPRKCFLMAPAGEKTILILGGAISGNRYLSDGMVINFEGEAPRKESSITHHETEFFVEYNNYCFTKDGSIMVAAQDKNKQSHMLEVSRDGRHITELSDL